MRRVSSRTLALKRSMACGAMRRRGCFPPVKLKPRNLRTLGLATALLALLTLSLRRLVEELLDALHHPLARPLAAHIDVAVVGVAHEAMAALLQFLVQHVQHQIRQQRRERPALRRAFLRRADQPIRQHARSQKAADQLQDALVGHPLRHQPHQDVVIDPIEELLQIKIHHDSRARTRCTPAPVPPPDAPSAPAGSRSSPRRTSGPSPPAAPASPPAG